MAVKSYRELIVWQKAMDLAESLYKLTSVYPREEVYGLTAQTRRSAVSIASNIAEGQGRNRYPRDFVRHLSIARGSLMELETHLVLIERFGYASREELEAAWSLIRETGKLLNGLISSLVRREVGSN